MDDHPWIWANRSDLTKSDGSPENIMARIGVTISSSRFYSFRVMEKLEFLRDGIYIYMYHNLPAFAPFLRAKCSMEHPGKNHENQSRPLSPWLRKKLQDGFGA